MLLVGGEGRNRTDAKAFEVKLEPEQFKGVRVQKTAQRGRGGRAFQPYAGQERTVVLEKA
jgi:hypothetical protein